jgi:hypothetical protein
MVTSNSVFIKMWDNKSQTYCVDVPCDVLLSSSRFNRLKSEYESENGVYLITLMDDGTEVNSFYAEDIDFL